MFVKANEIVAMCLMISVIIVTAPANARSRTHHAGHHTHAQAAGDAFASGVMSVDRAEAIRACSAKAKQWSQYAWGVTESQQYRGCMYERGQPE
jgi:hypothetical protein